MEKMNEKTFNNALKIIAGTGEKLAQAIHEAGLFAIGQANEHGNVGFGQRLIEAMGKKHDAQRVVNWLCFYGKFGVKSGVLVYRKRKDIGPENLEAMLEKANDNPYWIHTPQKQLVFKVNYLSMLESILHKHESAVKRAEAGEEVEESNVELLAQVKAIIEKAKAKPEAALETGAPVIQL